MIKKTKGRNGGDRATRKTIPATYSKGIPCRIKALIVGAACWGVLPVKLAEWLIRVGGLRHE